MRSRILFVCVALVVAACGDSPEDAQSTTGPPPTTAAPGATVSAAPTPPATPTTPTTSPPITAPPVTTATTPPSSPPAPPPPEDAAPSYFVFGPTGLVRVAGSEPEQLVSEPVDWARDDMMGGVVFTYASGPDADGVLWLRAGETQPEPIARDPAFYAYPAFTGVLNGQALLFFAGFPEGADLEGWECGDWALSSRELLTGAERAHMCLPIEDAGLGIGSVGGGRFVGAPYGQCGGTFTSTAIEFWDGDGNAVEIPDNPLPLSTIPCELEAILSADGSRLAYLHRPDSYHPASPFYTGPPCNGLDQHADWWEQSRSIPATLAVVDLSDGRELWRTEFPAGSHLVDFDGRYIAIRIADPAIVWGERTAGSFEIVDTWVRSAPIQIDFDHDVSFVHSVGAAFWTTVLASLETDEFDYEEARERANELRSAGLAVEILLSDDHFTLNPGYWVLHYGRFESRAAAATRCRELAPQPCYPRYIAASYGEVATG